jgi:hypothetical protein
MRHGNFKKFLSYTHITVNAHTYPLFLWKMAGDDISGLLISAMCFPKLSDQDLFNTVDDSVSCFPLNVLLFPVSKVVGIE